MASDGIPEILWSPPNAGKTPMDVYRRHVNQRFHQNFKDTQQLQLWSCDKPQDFWVDLYSYLNLVPPLPSTVTRAYDDSLPMSANPPFFEGLKMNYAENAMFSNPNPDAVALIGLREDQDLSKEDGERLTWHQFREQVRLTASALKRGGVGQGDRVAALVATSIWAVVLFHATASIGAIFTSISPDLGLEGCVARLQQVTPSILFADNAAIYKGKTVQTITKLDQILSRLKPRPQTYVIPIVDHPSPYSTISKFLEKADPSDKLTFTRVSFNDPLLIAYSSGTTGTPKCIVHRHGLILQFKKISVLHNYLGPDDVIMAYCSTSWIVFSIMCGHFSVGATTICYNGSPLYPATTHLLRVAAKFGATFFGTSPRYLLEVEMSKCIPKSDFDLSKLKLVYTTGATLSIEQYRWFYRAFPSAVQLCNSTSHPLVPLIYHPANHTLPTNSSRRHRHLHLPHRPRPQRPHLRRRDADPRPRHGHRRRRPLHRRQHPPHRRRRRARHPQALPQRALLLLGRRGRQHLSRQLLRALRSRRRLGSARLARPQSPHWRLGYEWEE